MSRPAPRSVRLIVGLEIHVELSTRSKMFAAAPNPAHPDFRDAAPNTLVDPVVAALPGALPTMNGAAVERSMRVGLALGCRVGGAVRWDRKNYFYPDLPKGYQISQYDRPLCGEGALAFDRADGSTGRVRILRAHLEEDAGKLGHELPGGRPAEGTLVDLDRAGAPLLEIVTHPDLDDAEDAVRFARELRTLCRFVGATEGDMQRGHVRFEPNVNLELELDDDRRIRTPIVEVKNLNSFRSLRAAIEHEAKRQVEQWRRDGLEAGPGTKTTRGWDDAKAVTFEQRSKEDAHDYRYFPDPDLPPLMVDEAWCERVREALPELPAQLRARWSADHGLDAADAALLAEEPGDAALFDEAVAQLAALRPGLDAAARGTATAKLLLNAVAKRANERGVALHQAGIAARRVAETIALREEGAIGSSAADVLVGLLCERDGDARERAEAEGLIQVSDAGALDAWIDAAIEAQAAAAADFAAGKDAAAGRLVGEVMKRSGGRADAPAVRARLVERFRG